MKTVVIAVSYVLAEAHICPREGVAVGRQQFIVMV